MFIWRSKVSPLLYPFRHSLRKRCLSEGVSALPSRAQVVVCGGGVVGSSVAYHLPKCGFTDVVHLEQGSLGCGTTWHSAGLLGAVRGSRAHTKLTAYSNELYSTLEAETGVGTGFRPSGNITVATTPGRMSVLRRQQAIGRSLGIESSIISAKECGELCPYLRTDDVLGALYFGTDLCAGDPSDICRSMAVGAQQQGVKLFEGVTVNGVQVKDGRVAGVSTSQGEIECEIFINCAGQWARDLGYLSSPSVNLPLHSTEHFYVVTKPFEGIDRDMPTIRDHDNHLYIRHWSGGIMAGCFETNGKPVFEDGVPSSFEFQLLPEDWDHCQPLMDSILHRVPAVANAEIRQMCNGPESFTPDMNSMMGEAPEIQNYYVCAAMNSTGIATAGGAGRALAEWIQHGEPPFDLWEFDVARLSRHSSNRLYQKHRAVEVLGRHYIIPWPHKEMESGRRVKMTPYHTRLDDAGASWGCVNGWERPNWFQKDPNGSVENSKTFHKMNYFDAHEEEHLACRKNVALFDLTAFSKLEVKGEGAMAALQYMCTGDVDLPVGHVIYTGFLNHQGGYLTDCTITRLDKDRYFIVSPSGKGTQVAWWVKKHVPSSVTVEDKTSSYCVLAVMGPRSREMLQTVTRTSLSNSSFPYSTSQIMEVGYSVDVIGLRMSYVGELGWELYVPMEYALHVYDVLSKAGSAYNMSLAGAYAMDSLRMEKTFRHTGHEMDSETTPVEARLMHSVNLNKGDFIGRETIIQQKQDGVKQLFATFTVDIPFSEEVPWGKELIYRDGKYCGYVTSASYGYTVGKHICMGYVSDGQNISLQYLKRGSYEIEVGGQRYPAKISTTPLYDPNSAIPRSS